MKLISISIIMAGMFMITACGKTTRFPVSAYAPAADIKAKTKIDKNNNHVITVTAKNLANADRIDSGSTYVLWMETKNNEVKNLGQLENKNAETASLTTVTPFEPKEFFITLENSGSVSSPSGKEISRAEIIDTYGDSGSMDDENRMDTDDNSGTRNSGTFSSPSDTTRIK
ncbi:MAG: hypothetical protein ACM3ME_10720 [Chloroflexota bacterium]|nr:hypothetical protein [Lentimicrobium sp.]